MGTKVFAFVGRALGDADLAFVGFAVGLDVEDLAFVGLAVGLAVEVLDFVGLAVGWEFGEADNLYIPPPFVTTLLS